MTGPYEINLIGPFIVPVVTVLVNLKAGWVMGR
jgi:hypothetical protein